MGAKTLRKGQLKVMNSHRFFWGGDGNIVELYSGDGCTTLEINFLKPSDLYSLK